MYVYFKPGHAIKITLFYYLVFMFDYGDLTLPPAQPLWKVPQAVPIWQLCPKCNGAGIVYTEWTGSGPFSTTCECDVCNGKKIISVITGLPPQ